MFISIQRGAIQLQVHDTAGRAVYQGTYILECADPTEREPGCMYAV